MFIERIKDGLYLKWSRAYSLDHEMIDSQHMALFSLYNNLVASWENHMPTHIIIESLRLFQMKALFHFNAEEDLMYRHCYKETYKHAKLHRVLIEKLDAYCGSIKQDPMQLNESRLNFLKYWLLDHTQTEDRALIDMIKAK